MHRRRLHPLALTAALAASLLMLIPARLVAAQEAKVAEKAIPGYATLDRRAAEIALLPYVSKRVGITKDQADAITKVWLDGNPKMRTIGLTAAKMKTNGVPVAERIAYEDKAKNDLYQEIAQGVLATVKPEQKAQLRQIVLENDGPLMLGEKVVGAQIGLSDVKISKIAALEAEARRLYERNSREEASERMKLFRTGANLPPEKQKRFQALDRKNRRFADAPQTRALAATYKLPVDDPKRVAARKTYAAWIEKNSGIQLTPAENEEFNSLLQDAGKDPDYKTRRERYTRQYKEVKARYNNKAYALLSTGERAKWAKLIGKN